MAFCPSSANLVYSGGVVCAYSTPNELIRFIVRKSGNLLDNEGEIIRLGDVNEYCGERPPVPCGIHPTKKENVPSRA